MSFSRKYLIAKIQNIKTRKLLSSGEIERMKRDSVQRSPHRTAENIRRSIQRRSKALHQHIIIGESEQIDELTTPPEPDETIVQIGDLYHKIDQKRNGIRAEDRPRI